MAIKKVSSGHVSVESVPGLTNGWPYQEPETVPPSSWPILYIKCHAPSKYRLVDTLYPCLQHCITTSKHGDPDGFYSTFYHKIISRS